MYVTDMKQVLTKLRKNGIDLLSTKPLTTTTTTTTSSSPSSSSGGHNSDREVPEVRIENYHEMSMREARRCDLRNGTAMKSLAAATTTTGATTTNTNTATTTAASTVAHATTAIHALTSTTQTHTTTPASSTDIQAATKDLCISRDNVCVDLRGHRGVIGVLTEVANPPGGELASGNWVRVYYMGIGIRVYVLFRPCVRYFC